MELQKGSVVLSRAGRDKGKFYAVVGVADGEYVFIVNGKMRPLAAPKRKKKLHLTLINDCDEGIVALIEQGQMTDRRLHECLADYDKKV